MTGPEGSIRVTTAAQHKAMGHPLRQRLLFSLGQEPATTSQLAATLGVAKGSIGHHLKVLREAGLVRVVETRTVRGGTEQYFVPVSRRVRFGGGRDGAALRVMLANVADEIPPDDHLLNHRHLRLTAAQAAALTEHLEQVITDLRPARAPEAEYGVIVGVWRKAD